jgi:hypothetical protein
VLEGPDALHVNGKAAQEQHAVLSRVQPVAEGVLAGAGGPAVAVEVHARIDARVHRALEEVGVVDRFRARLRLGQVALEERAHAAFRILVVVELVEQQDVGTHALDDLGDVADLRMIAVAERRRQFVAARRDPALHVVAALHAHVEGGDAQYPGRCGGAQHREPPRQEETGQDGAKPGA